MNSSDPIVIPSPVTVSVTRPVQVQLTPAQVQNLVALLGTQGINLPPNIKTLMLQMIQPAATTNPDGSQTVTNPDTAGGAVVTLRF
jgi:hypothetical protein